MNDPLRASHEWLRWVDPGWTASETWQTALTRIDQTMREAHLERSLTDWPFEHFWTNPYEPQHSKLLGYFLDPKEAHGCGRFLLQCFFDTLAGDAFTADGSVVEAERDYIDLSITRRAEGCRFAIIVENKINGAVDQPQQLQTYVEVMHGRGFDHKEIHVLYLPLTSAKEPDREDRSVIEGWGVHYRQITFQEHILGWLNAALGDGQGTTPAETLPPSMRENLVHYRSLVSYLVRQHEKEKMDEKIFAQIEGLHRAGALPSWAEANRLKEAAVAMERNLRIYLRGRFLRAVQEKLKSRGFSTASYLTGDGVARSAAHRPDEERVDHEQSLCLRVNEAVSVCVGGCSDTDGPYFIGYLRSGDAEAQKQCEPYVLDQIKIHLPRGGGGAPWYGWKWEKISYDESLQTARVDTVVDRLLRMRRELLAVLPGKPEGDQH